MYNYSSHQFYQQSAPHQQCSMFIEHTKQKHLSYGLPTSATVKQIGNIDSNFITIQPTIIDTQSCSQTLVSNKEKVKKYTINKTSVDTSHFTIEERLIAAVWVHERRNDKNSMGQIKRKFVERFGREPPAKSTLLAWERKLFLTGSVHDAPRTGRPVHRLNHLDAVAASVRSAPALSLRARAQALRLPRTTLRTILNKDLPPDKDDHKHSQPKKQTGQHQEKRNMKSITRSKLCLQTEINGHHINKVVSSTDSYT